MFRRSRSDQVALHFDQASQYRPPPGAPTSLSDSARADQAELRGSSPPCGAARGNRQRGACIPLVVGGDRKVSGALTLCPSAHLAPFANALVQTSGSRWPTTDMSTIARRLWRTTMGRGRRAAPSVRCSSASPRLFSHLSMITFSVGVPDHLRAEPAQGARARPCSHLANRS